MVTKSKAFPSKWLKPDELKGKPYVLTIDRVGQESMKFNGKSQEKTVVYFKGTNKGLILNLTNFESIEKITGQGDTDDWPGHAIEVYPTTVEMKGVETDCIRVRAPAQGDILAAAAKPPDLPPAPQAPPLGDLNDDIPF
jgi:hypothetical protein